MAALQNPRLERYCQFRSVSGTPGGRSKTSALWAAISPRTSVTEFELFRGLLDDPVISGLVATRFSELGGETVS